MAHVTHRLYTLALEEHGVPFVAQIDWRGKVTGGHHRHDETQILGVLNGAAYFTFESTTVQLDAGSIVVIPAKLWHAVGMEIAGPTGFIDLRIGHKPVNPLSQFLQNVPAQQAIQVDATHLNQVAQSLRAAVERSGSERVAAVLACVWQFFALTTRSVQVIQGSAADGALDWRVRMAEAFMEDRISRAIDVEDVADAVQLSRSQLTRLYMKQFGIGPAERLRQMRVKKAEVLLSTTTLSIKEIAHACGFVCANHFSRTFHDETGRAPSHIRS